MNQLLTAGQCVVTESSFSECTIEKFLGGGGQGEVYEAKVGGRLFALKWYFPASATAQQRNAWRLSLSEALQATDSYGRSSSHPRRMFPGLAT